MVEGLPIGHNDRPFNRITLKDSYMLCQQCNNSPLAGHSLSIGEKFICEGCGYPTEVTGFTTKIDTANISNAITSGSIEVEEIEITLDAGVGIWSK